LNVTISSSVAVSPPPLRCHRLANGLTLVHHYLPATDVAAVDVWVRAGAITEPDAWLGMAHFLEHMVFKGSQRVPPGAFDAAIEQFGGSTNAATSQDYAHFFITTAAAHLAAALPYLAEILLQAAIPDDEFDRERDVVLEEIRQTADNPDWLAFQALNELAYPGHAYGRPILGTEASLRDHTPAAMRQFHHTHYQPENITIVLVGNIPEPLALDLVAKHFAQFPPRPAPVSPICAPLRPPLPSPGLNPFSPFNSPPPATIHRQELGLPRLEQARLLLAWHGPGVTSPHRSLEDQLQTAYGLDVLAIVLAEGRTSRLVKELREERQLVQGIASGYALQRESGLFTISAWLDPEHLERVEAIICDRLAELLAHPITPAELSRSQRLLCNDHAFATETPSQLAGLYGYYSLLGDPTLALSYCDRIQALDTPTLQTLANQYLSPTHYTATLIRPL
jgi:zinc protease